MSTFFIGYGALIFAWRFLVDRFGPRFCAMGGILGWGCTLFLSSKAQGIQCGHLGNNFLRLGNVDQNQAGRGQIKRFSWQSCIGGVPLANLHVVDSSLRKKFSSQLDSMIAQFHPNHRARGTDVAGKQFEATLRTTADLDYSGSLCQPNPIEECGRFVSEFLGLLLQASLLDRAWPRKY